MILFLVDVLQHELSASEIDFYTSDNL